MKPDKHSYFYFSPYSLGKLIDWKPTSATSTNAWKLAPYSLGKLIDWKPPKIQSMRVLLIPASSLLARETN